jgi:hypothetical protein
MDVDDLKAFVRDNRHLFPERTELWVDGQSPQAVTMAINAIESMAPFTWIDIIPSGSLDDRWPKRRPVDFTNIKTDVPIHWRAFYTYIYDSTPIFDPSKIRDLRVSGTVQLRPSSDEIRLRRLTTGDLDKIIGIHYVKDHLLSLKLKGRTTVAVHSFEEFSSLKVLDMRRGSSPPTNKLPVVVLPPSLDTLKLTGFKWGVLIRGKVDHAKVMPDSHGTPGEYRFTTSPDFIWVTTTTAGYHGASIWGNIDDYKVVAGKGWKRLSGTRDQIQTTSAPFFAVKVR